MKEKEKKIFTPRPPPIALRGEGWGYRTIFACHRSPRAETAAFYRIQKSLFFAEIFRFEVWKIQGFGLKTKTLNAICEKSGKITKNLSSFSIFGLETPYLAKLWHKMIKKICGSRFSIFWFFGPFLALFLKILAVFFKKRAKKGPKIKKSKIWSQRIF